jgi:DNA-binding CsgD family transcriptional regulator/ParB-like chromosome segregation protein Spo0J
MVCLVGESAEVVEVELDFLVLDGSPRSTGEDPAHTRVLAEAGESLPPILVHRQTMRVIDGMHRYHVCRLRGLRTISVRFFDGSAEEAFVQAVHHNIAHGLPLSLADRKAAAARVVGSHPQWSDRRIGAATGLSDKTVRTIRRSSTADGPQSNVRIGRDGRARPVDGTAARRRANEVLAARPDASLRQIARSAGISPSTARDVRARRNRGEGEPAKTGGGTTPERDWIAVLEGMRNDPSLKYSDSGREILRWLSSHAIEPQDWHDIVAVLPAHCVDGVAQIARGCSDAWQRLAHELAQRTPAAGERRTDVTGLTPAEHRIAELVANGMSNRAIARTLFVTPRAVELHLTHIYRKLELGGRTELADLMNTAVRLRPGTGR